MNRQWKTLLTKELAIENEGTVLQAHGEQWNVKVALKTTESERKRKTEKAHLAVAIRRQGYSIAFSKCFQNIVKLRERWEKQGEGNQKGTDINTQGKRTNQGKDWKERKQDQQQPNGCLNHMPNQFSDTNPSTYLVANPGLNRLFSSVWLRHTSDGQKSTLKLKCK